RNRPRARERSADGPGAPRRWQRRVLSPAGRGPRRLPARYLAGGSPLRARARDADRAHGAGDVDARRERPERSARRALQHRLVVRDRKSTRLNSSHVAISYAVFCLKKKRLKKVDVTKPKTYLRHV